MCVGVCLVAVLLFAAWQHFELLQHGYRLEQLQRDRAAEADIARHLQLEIETLDLRWKQSRNATVIGA